MSDIKPNQIEKLLNDLMKLKEKMANTKEILKSYKIKSDRLSQLKRAKQEIGEQMEDEKKRIEDEFLVDKDYETATNDELTLKNQLKEKNAELREAMAQVNKAQDLSTYDYNINGSPLKLQVQRVVKVYINGKEEK